MRNRGKRRFKNMKIILKDSGYRITSSRKAIIDVLNKTSDHLSAEDIFFEVHKNYPNVGLTTIYRTLDLLTKMSIVYKFDFGDGRARYELAEDHQKTGHHHHLICNNCKKIIDYNDFMDEEKEFLLSLQEKLSKKYSFKINNHLIQFYGLCSNCITN